MNTCAILPVDKPAGWTSFDVLAKLRGALGTRRLGHAGTLDPMATGVLAVFIGNATAAADRQPDHDKTYEATIRLGLRTDTGDVTGTVLETAPVTVGEAAAESRSAPQFMGPADADAADVFGGSTDQRPWRWSGKPGPRGTAGFDAAGGERVYLSAAAGGGRAGGAAPVQWLPYQPLPGGRWPLPGAERAGPVSRPCQRHRGRAPGGKALCGAKLKEKE